MVGWFHTSNAYLRYIIDWMREGVLIIPSDIDKPLVLPTNTKVPLTGAKMVFPGSALDGIVLVNLGATGSIVNNVVSNNGDMVSAVAGGAGSGRSQRGGTFPGPA